MRYTVQVTFKAGKPIGDPASYVEDAVACMGKSYHPDSPEFSIDSDLVEAKAIEIEVEVVGATLDPKDLDGIPTMKRDCPI